MKRTIIEFQPSDRNIVLFSVADKLIGVNYWQGLGDMSVADAYLLPDAKLDLRSFIGKPLNTAIELIDVVDELIWQSITEQSSTYIPNGQRKLIQKALKFYVETAEKFSDRENDYQGQHTIFDMNQLEVMMNYPISIEISQYDKDTFASRHGYDFPIYYSNK